MNPIKKTALLLMLGMPFYSFSQKHSVTAEIEGLGNDTILVEYAPISKMHEIQKPMTDKLVAVNGKFVFDLKTDEPTMVFMFPKKGEFKRSSGSAFRALPKYVVMELKPGDVISVKGKLEKYYLDYEATGSEFNKEYSALRKTYIKDLSESVKIELKLDSMMAAKADKDAIETVFQKRNEISQLEPTKQLDFIRKNLNKELSAYYLTRQKLDTLNKYYEKLTPGVKDGAFKNMLQAQMLRYQKYIKSQQAEKTVVEGAIAPDFTLKSLSGADFQLSSLTGKYLVLDFWGSWCGWCIKGIPKMKEYYTKYKDKMEIVGIACNDTEEKWKKAVQEYSLPWVHVINDKDLNKDVSSMYGIRGYPTKLILDKDHKIVAKIVGESDEFYQKLDELMAK